MIKIKTAAEIARMRESGRVAAEVRNAVAKAVKPGVSTKELNDYADHLIRSTGGTSAFLGYHGYPGHICVSVNEEVVHGIPGTRVIQIGDIVSLDVGVAYNGYIGDTATTVMVGVNDEEILKLVSATQKALEAGISKAVPGGRLSDISHAVESVANEHGLGVVREYVGHGIGKKMHEDPQIPNFGRPGNGPRLKKGMTFAIEPMFNLGTFKTKVLDDGWTVVTQDHLPAAHFEHTIAIQDETPEILTIA